MFSWSLTNDNFDPAAFSRFIRTALAVGIGARTLSAQAGDRHDRFDAIWQRYRQHLCHERADRMAGHRELRPAEKIHDAHRVDDRLT